MSRLLGVHVNLAKQLVLKDTLFDYRLLYEFHQQAKVDGKPCHATYILCGTIEEPAHPPEPLSDAMQIEGEDFLISSPPVATQESSKLSGAITKMVFTVTLADENHVNGNLPSLQSNRIEAKQRFSELTSIHVYSLGPAIVQVVLLSGLCG